MEETELVDSLKALIKEKSRHPNLVKLREGADELLMSQYQIERQFNTRCREYEDIMLQQKKKNLEHE